ncbi:MAG TPA: thioredoxin-like domain-containing protein [Chthoniobacterales bacterium]
MRIPLVLFLLGFSFTSLAELRPLTMKDVGLMIRSGYSSQSLLQELAQRGASEPLDDTTRKVLLDFHVSPQLLDGLEHGAFLVSAAAAERARTDAAQEAERQVAETTRIYQNVTAVLQEQHARDAAAARPPAGTSLADSLKGKMVVCRDGTISAASDADFEKKKLIAFYFSAHWCSPCRKFTPQLVEYYRQNAARHPEFEVVFVSNDRSRFNWETYMRETGMPWPAIDFDQTDLRKNLGQVGGEGIPSLVLLDATGRLIASSYDGKKYLGPQNVLAVLDQMWSQSTAAR